jgi:hypothetical protein
MFEFKPSAMSCTLRHRRRKVAVAAAVVTLYLTLSLFKTPQNDSALTGHAWVHELLAGHPCRFHNMMGISKHVFWRLARELQEFWGLHDSKHVALEEQLAIFLHLCQTGGSNQYLQKRFQCGPETFSKYEQFILSVWW